jgi:transcriptional pleiotropic regulator of transition state genes
MRVNLDELGRIVIPIQIRREYGIKRGNKLEAIELEDGVLIKTVDESCVICGGNEKLISLEEKFICEKCIEKGIEKMK